MADKNTDEFKLTPDVGAKTDKPAKKGTCIKEEFNKRYDEEKVDKERWKRQEERPSCSKYIECPYPYRRRNLARTTDCCNDDAP